MNSGAPQPPRYYRGIWRLDTFGSRIALALLLVGSALLGTAALLAWLHVRSLALDKGVAALQMDLTQATQRARASLTQLTEVGHQLATSPLLASASGAAPLPDLGPLLLVLREALRRNGEDPALGLRDLRLEIVSTAGVVLASSDRQRSGGYPAAPWLRRVSDGVATAAYLADSHQLLIAHPVVLPGSSRVRALVLARADVGALLGLDSASRAGQSDWQAGPADALAALERNPGLRVLRRPLDLPAPLDELNWQGAVSMSQATLAAEARQLLWPYLSALLAGLPLLAGAGLWIDRRLSRPLDQLARSAAGISAESPEALERLGNVAGEVREIDNLKRTLALTFTRILQATSEMRLAHSALDSAGEGIAVLVAGSADTPICLANRALERFTGRRATELLGQPYAALFATAQVPPDLSGLRAALQAGAAAQLVVHLPRADGPGTALEISVAPVRDLQGVITHHVVIHTDISERQQTEERLRATQKLEALGQLTGGLAHDFNNLLAIVIGNLDALEGAQPGTLAGPAVSADPQFAEALAAARAAAARGAAVTRTLLAVASRQPLTLIHTDLNQVVRDTLPLLRASVGPGLDIVPQCCPEPLPVAIDPTGLGNALLNLVINARDAMHGQAQAGRITLTTAIATVPADDAELSAGQYAILAVSDNGPGMSEAVRRRIFEPFFTTKERGKGTGLGLAMVRGFTTQLGGTTRVSSAVGAGTAVRLLLPLLSPAPPAGQGGAAPEGPGDRPAGPADAVSAVAATTATTTATTATTTTTATIIPAAAAAGASTAPGHVLVVDDEPALCALATRWLRAAGYQPQTVTATDAALAALASTHFDILLTDIALPGPMDGIALARAARARQPGLRILLTSGYSPALLGDADLPGPLLTKPYSKDELLRALHALPAAGGDTGNDSGAGAAGVNRS